MFGRTEQDSSFNSYCKILKVENTGYNRAKVQWVHHDSYWEQPCALDNCCCCSLIGKIFLFIPYSPLKDRATTHTPLLCCRSNGRQNLLIHQENKSCRSESSISLLLLLMIALIPNNQNFRQFFQLYICSGIWVKNYSDNENSQLISITMERTYLKSIVYV